jgi:hypothetical protein
MGRWGDGIYDSDQALDYESTITDHLVREIVYRMTPEQVSHSGSWLSSVLAVIELILLFEYHDKGSSVYLLRELNAIPRWHETFFNVWDGNWTDDRFVSFAYYFPEYRQQHRAGVIALFDSLESIAQLWTNLDKNIRTEVMPMPPEYPLPYFSHILYKGQDGREFVHVDRFTGYLIEVHRKDIVYLHSPEYRSEALVFNAEEAWIAVDLLAFLCEIYELTPGVNQQTVRSWRETNIDIWKQFLEGDEIPWDESDPLYLNVIRAFDRLEAVARKHPPSW